jgi:uncharacterized integral membrane protein
MARQDRGKSGCRQASRQKSSSPGNQYIPFMKWLLIVVGALLILIGAVWVLQGTNVLTQGAMAGHMKWTLIGGLLAAVGIVLFVIGILKKRTVRTT